jgi:hypothetical protein
MDDGLASKDVGSGDAGLVDVVHLAAIHTAGQDGK